MVLAWASPFRYHLLNMLKKNVTSISNIWKQMTFILSNLNNFHSLEVMDRVSETQLQLSENLNNLPVKGLIMIIMHLITHITLMHQMIFLYKIQKIKNVISN